MNEMPNPLLNFAELPYFKSIKAEHVIPALESVLADNRAKITQLEQVAQPNWNNFAAAMESLDEQLGRVWSPVGHLNAVQDSSELREAYQAGIALLTDYHSEIGQNQKLYAQFQVLSQPDIYDGLSPARKKVIDNNLLDFRLSGADLNNHKQTQLREINRQLSELSNQFERNVLDATQAWEKLITDVDELSGLPQSALDMAAQLATDAGQQGFLLNLQLPSCMAIMQHADSRNLRQEMYSAYSTRASELSANTQFDNAPLIDDILMHRQTKAKLLGYAHYAEYSLVKKMAKSSAVVIDFLEDLARYAKPVALTELEELNEFAESLKCPHTLEAWDISYYAEKLRESRYSFNDEQVKPYFPAPQVFDGLFEIVNRLFGISLLSNSTMETWHPDVQCFDVLDNDQQLIGQLYTDLYVRKNKRGGAWMDTCIDRRVIDDTVQLPVAYLTCNFTPPIGDDPALLTHGEVETLFHEFGHTLHHLLTQVSEMSVAGINGVAWDAVELPSQFMENWCWHEQSIRILARHYKTGELIPDSLLAKMRDAKNFQSGMQCLRQVEFALFDMLIHCTPQQAEVQKILDQVRQQVAVLLAPKENRFQNSFGHIFAGGYAAGYYSYKWAEVLSADAFGRFEDEGIFNPDTGRDFLQSVLQRGGVEDANTLFEEFRGRGPEIQPLLRQTGIL